MTAPADPTALRLGAWLAAMGQGDWTAVMAGLAEDVTFAAPLIYRAGQRMPRPGFVTGKPAIEAMFAARAALVEDAGFDLQGYGGAAGQGWAIAETTERLKETGAEYTLRAAVHFTFDARGRIARWESLFDPSPQIAVFRPALDAALIAALAACDEPGALRLLAEGADPSARDDAGLTALMIAAGRDLPGAVERLLAAGADPLAKDPGEIGRAHV